MKWLEAEGLVLEPQVEAHAIELFEVLSDPALYEFENEAPASLAWLQERFRKLETRSSADGSESWLNWVIRLPDARLVGFTQATVRSTGEADLAYVLSSKHWGKSIARRSVEAVMVELAAEYNVHTHYAVFKRRNERSRQLLQRLGFELASSDECTRHGVEADETLMLKRAGR